MNYNWVTSISHQKTVRVTAPINQTMENRSSSFWISSSMDGPNMT